MEVFSKVARSVRRLQYGDDFDALIRMLDDKDTELRREAVRKLGYLKDKRAIQPLLDHLHDNKIRSIIISILGHIGDKSVIETLVPYLDDEQAAIRSITLRTLASLGAPYLADKFFDMFYNDKGITVRGAAAQALGHTGDKRALQPLTDALYSDNSIRWSALQGLWSLGDISTIEMFINIYRNKQILEEESEDNDFFKDLSAALASFGEPALIRLIELTSDEDKDVRLGVLWALDKFDDARATDAIRKMREKDPDVDIQVEAGEILRRREPQTDDE
jgi:HEAT repeat protein